MLIGGEFSVWALVAGFIFGTWGIFVFRSGRRDMNIRRVVLGLALMLYGLFVANPWACWGIGLVLVGINHFTAWANEG